MIADEKMVRGIIICDECHTSKALTLKDSNDSLIKSGWTFNKGESKTTHKCPECSTKKQKKLKLKSRNP